MKKQKHGFWVFIFSLIPGAGEMYMGFKKQGLSIMLLFWGSIALASITGLGWLAMFLPVIWFYSFFNVHNLKSLSEEEFYSVEDNYILHMDQFSGDMGKFLQKHQSAAAWILILFGICILWSRFTSLLYFIVPNNMADYVYNICNSLPQIVIAAGGGGIPVLEQGTQLNGASAIIEKDLAAGLLAEELNADTLMILTSVEKVSLDHNTDHESYLDTISTEDAKKYIAGKQFAAGSMLPKIEAGVSFVEKGTGRRTIITDMAHAKDGYREKTGTIIK